MNRKDQATFGLSVFKSGRRIHGLWIMISAGIAPTQAIARAIARGVGSFPPAWSGRSSPDFGNSPRWWPFPNS